MQNRKFMRAKDAGVYLKDKFGFGSEKSLNKLACLGGGPEFHKAGPARLYTPEALDEWAMSKIGAAQKSTSDTAAA
ncbi:hypothetical protein [Methylocystis sp. B8]|uniref:hypothetical protein n=1 Tax=Methylocystis sp. B8 TaxID=544938 RepID=UPI0010FCE4AA|nr:hypothetical protein [Methylocystis sp. B8]TLG75153.1 hypothetical protein FEV16_11635 [Methylocystis sp. B8]